LTAIFMRFISPSRAKVNKSKLEFLVMK